MLEWLSLKEWSPYLVGFGIGILNCIAFLLSDKPDLVACVNLEGIGAGTDLVVSRYEMRHGRVYRASDTVRARLAQAGGRALRELPWPLWTDAGPLLAAGIPALTLLTLPPDSHVIRGLHGGHDTLARFDPQGYAHARALLQRTVAAADVP